jgi:hypothetical protein
MPGCSNPPVTSASSRNRARLVGSSAWRSRICLRATSRFNRESSATKTAPRPPRAWGRRMRNRWPSEVAEPTERLAVRSGSSRSSASVTAPFAACARARRARVASIWGSLIEASPARVAGLAGTAARLFSTSPPWASRCSAAIASTTGRRAGARCPRATRWSARPFDRSRVHAWKAARSCAWLIRPFCRARSPKRSSRSAVTAAMRWASRETGAGDRQMAPDAGDLR